VQRAVLAVTTELKFNRIPYMADVRERLARLEEACDSGSIDQLTNNVCVHLEGELEKQGSSATLDSVMKELMAE
jgi:hypothetical protein